MEILLNVYHVWPCFFWKFSLLRRKRTLYSPSTINTPRSRASLEFSFQVKSPKPWTFFSFFVSSICDLNYVFNWVSYYDLLEWKTHIQDHGIFVNSFSLGPIWVHNKILCYFHDFHRANGFIGSFGTNLNNVIDLVYYV